MKQYFEENRGLLYEIRDLAAGGCLYAADIMGTGHNARFCLAVFSVIEKNASKILKLFDCLEYIPGVEGIEKTKRRITA